MRGIITRFPTEMMPKYNGIEPGMMHGENSLSFIASRLQTELDILNRSSQRPWRLSMSIGVVDATPTTDRSLDALLAEADQAMYASKRARRQSPGEPPNQTLHLTGAAFLDSRGMKSS